MAIYFYFYKLAVFEALTTLLCALISLASGIYMNISHRSLSKKLFDHPDIENIDAAEFKDAYLHPCYRKQREYERAKINEVPIVVDYELEEEEEATETQLLLN